MKQHLVWYVLCFTRYQVQLFFVMSNQNFVMFDQDGVLVGHLSI